MKTKLIEIRVIPLGCLFCKGQPIDVTAAHVQAAVSYYNAVRNPSSQLIAMDYEHQSVKSEVAGVQGSLSGAHLQRRQRRDQRPGEEALWWPYITRNGPV